MTKYNIQLQKAATKAAGGGKRRGVPYEHYKYGRWASIGGGPLASTLYNNSGHAFVHNRKSRDGENIDTYCQMCVSHIKRRTPFLYYFSWVVVTDGTND